MFSKGIRYLFESLLVAITQSMTLKYLSNREFNLIQDCTLNSRNEHPAVNIAMNSQFFSDFLLTILTKHCIFTVFIYSV